MELFRKEYLGRVPFPPPGDLSYPGIEPALPVSPALAGRFSYSQNHGILYTLDTAMVYMTLRSVYLHFSGLAEQSFCVITCDWHNTHSTLLLYGLINDFLKANFNLIFVPSPKKKKKKPQTWSFLFFQMCIVKGPFNMSLIGSEYIKMHFYLHGEKIRQSSQNFILISHPETSGSHSDKWTSTIHASSLSKLGKCFHWFLNIFELLFPTAFQVYLICLWVWIWIENTFLT